MEPMCTRLFATTKVALSCAPIVVLTVNKIYVQDSSLWMTQGDVATMVRLKQSYNRRTAAKYDDPLALSAAFRPERAQFIL